MRFKQNPGEYGSSGLFATQLSSFAPLVINTLTTAFRGSNTFIARSALAAAFLLLLLFTVTAVLNVAAQPGSLDTNFSPVVSGRVYAIRVQADQKILIGGEFQNVNNQSHPTVA